MMPLEEMRPFLAVSADADPEQHPELLERIKSHREHIVSQIASLQQVVDFIDSKLGDGNTVGTARMKARTACRRIGREKRTQNPFHPPRGVIFPYRPKRANKLAK